MDLLSGQPHWFYKNGAIVSKPMPEKKELWYGNALLWESARPYLYLRTTEDHRVLIGGKDEMFQSAIKRDKLLNRKSRELKRRMAYLTLVR